MTEMTFAERRAVIEGQRIDGVKAGVDGSIYDGILASLDRVERAFNLAAIFGPLMLANKVGSVTISMTGDECTVKDLRDPVTTHPSATTGGQATTGESAKLIYENRDGTLEYLGNVFAKGTKLADHLGIPLKGGAWRTVLGNKTNGFSIIKR
jgi:hypothetical protein